MDITLNSDEINQAIISHINTQGISTEGKNITVLIVSGRKGNGCKAEVTISNEVNKAILTEVSPEDECDPVEPNDTVTDQEVTDDVVTGSIFAKSS